MNDLRKAAEQALEALCTCGQQQKEAKEALRQALAQPDEVLAEREACAKVCEQPIDEIQVTDDCSDIVYMDGLECASAIRARGEK